MTDYKQAALELALKMLGFDDYEDYYNLVARVEDKSTTEFKYWEAEDGRKESLLMVIEGNYVT